jgi:hypothetical protein
VISRKSAWSVLAIGFVAAAVAASGSTVVSPVTGRVAAGARASGSTGIELASVGPGGKQSYCGMGDPLLSGDGRRVLFKCPPAPEFAPLPPAGNWGLGGFLYVRDRAANSMRLVSVGPGGTAPETITSAQQPALSDDGRFAAFESSSTRLACAFGVCNVGERSQVYVRDIDAGTLHPALVDSSGLPVESDRPAISGDGRLVAFREDLAGVPANQFTVVERTSGRVQRILLSGVNPKHVQLTKAGGSLVYTSSVGFSQHWSIVDRETGTSTRLDVASDGTPANGSNCQAGSSDDGSRVAFISDATNLGGATDGGGLHLYVRDLASGHTERHDFDPAGGPVRSVIMIVGGASGTSPALSGDGRFVAFATVGAIYVRDIGARRTQRVDVATDCGAPDLEPEDEVSISDDGRYIAFISRAVNLVSHDANGHTEDVFVRDRLATCTRPAAPSGPWIAAAALSTRTTTRGSFGRVVLRFSVLRAGDVSVTLDRRSGAGWRKLAWIPLGRLTPGPRQSPLATVFHRFSPPQGTYRLLLKAGKTMLRLPLVVR